ncbi:MAG: hypothetical protein MJK04_20450 [Psychrosphaera sp.]|nr:hypothetical protein [Psychrosphaera sp.]
MIQLSKKGWNNVLIFSMLLMIMVFNGMHKNLGGREPTDTDVLILPENSLVLTLNIGDIAIERIGQGWRANPAVNMDLAQLTDLMARWKAHKAQWQMDDNEAKVMTDGIMPQFIVIATLAGKTDGAVYAFYPQLEEVWSHDQFAKRWLKAPIGMMSELFPKPLILKPKS